MDRPALLESHQRGPKHRGSRRTPLPREPPPRCKIRHRASATQGPQKCRIAPWRAARHCPASLAWLASPASPASRRPRRPRRPQRPRRPWRPWRPRRPWRPDVPGVPGIPGVPGVPGVHDVPRLASLASRAPCGAIPQKCCPNSWLFL